MPRMFGTSIMLREFMQSDLDEMCKWKSDPESTRYLSDTFTVPQTWEQSANFLDSILMNALEELINKCDGYEPYYCDSHNDSFSSVRLLMKMQIHL